MLKNMWALVAHGHNQQQALERAAQAQALGLDAAKYGAPFPGAQVNMTTTHNTTGGWLKGALLGASLLAAGVGAGLVANGALKPTAPAATPAVEPAAIDGWDAIYEEQQPDGSWKQIRREHLK